MNNAKPNFTETIICLANSRKTSGRCIAGKRLTDYLWLRPVSSRITHEISEYDRRYSDGNTAQLLDIIEIPCIKRQPNLFQTENVLIDENFYWRYAGKATLQQVNALTDDQADLWINGYGSYYNINNRVPEALLDYSAGSLRLIRLNKINLHVSPKAPEFGEMKHIIRASFNYLGENYKLDVTDPHIEHHFLSSGLGDYVINDVIACISLGELFSNRNGELFAYKLVASIIQCK